MLRLTLILVVSAVYFLAAKLGLSLAIVAEQVSLVWPPTGIALSALLLLGYRVWPGVALGAFAANATANEPFGTAAGIAAGNTLEAVSAVWLLQRIGFQASLERFRDVLGLIGLSALLSTMVGATIGVTSLGLGGVEPWSRFGLLWLVWWIGDALGALVFAPPILTWSRWQRRRWRTRLVAEAALLFIALVLVLWLVFGGGGGHLVLDENLEFVVFPFVIWAAVRFRQRGTTLVVLLTSIVAIWGTLSGFGPFAAETAHESLLLLQTFMAVVAITALSLSAGVAERNAAERGLRESHELLAAISEGTTDAVYVKDLEGRYLMINPAGARLLGRPVDGVLGKTDAQLFRDSTEGLSHQERIIMREGVPQTYEEVGTAAGVTRTYLSTKGPYRDPFGRVIGLVGISRDISERKEAEERLKKEHALRRAIEESMPAGVAAIDLEGRQSYVNPAFCRMVGWSEEELLGAPPPFVYWPPEERAALETAFEATLRGEAPPAGFELRFLRRGGERFDVLVQISRLVDSAGAVSGWLASVLDISDRKHIERALRHSEERYRSLVLASAQVVWTTNAEGRVVENLPDWRELTGRSVEELRGFGWMEVLHPDDRERVTELWSHSLTTGTSHVNEFRVRRRDGEYRYVLARAVPVLEPDGSVREWVGTVTDITDRKRAEHERAQLLEQEKALRAQADEANRQKDEFLGMLSHELRNPLAPIRNALEILQLDSRPETLGWVLELMGRQTRHLSRLVDDLLDVSRITRGRIELRKETAELAVILRQAIEATAPLVASRGHQLHISVPETPLPILGDVTRLEQVFVNLLNNAAKYTPRNGHVWLTVEGNGGAAVVRVRDDGIGIPPDLLPRVFDLFSQADRSLARSEGGLGIGLTLVRKLVEMHGGTVRAQSEGAGKGSELVVCLPLRLEDAPAQKGTECVRQPAPPAVPVRVLVVEDNADTAESLAAVLELFGHEVRVAHDGPEALEKARSFQPAVVLLDIGLPGMDGYEVARRLRASGGAMLLVAVTGYGRESDRRLSREAGFDEQLVKPVAPETLRDFLASLADSSTT